MSIYEADISIYKYYRSEYKFANYGELMSINKDIIYQNYWCDCVMQQFLNSNDFIQDIVDMITIKSWDKYYDSGCLW
jgi:hypothetical protein